MEEKKKRPCGNPDCCCSTSIDDTTITYGSGELNEFGFWEFPCKICAKVAKDRGEKYVWPDPDKEIKE